LLKLWDAEEKETKTKSVLQKVFGS
jgi:hypothetical protein